MSFQKGHLVSSETREKISKALIGNKNGCKEIKQTKEQKGEYRKKYYQKNKNKIYKRVVKYYQEHKEELKEKKKKYYREHKEEIKRKTKKYQIENIEKIRKENREYGQAHKKEKREYNKEYRQRPDVIEKYKKYHKEYRQKPENKERRRKYLKEYDQKLENKKRRNKLRRKRREKRKNDIHYKLKQSVSSSIRGRLKRHLISKNGKPTFDFLPYTIDELIKYLESQFEPWMNRNNYGFGKGKWTIDHKKPQSKFNFANPDGTPNIDKICKCWALENLQPMEWYENCYVKQNKY